MSMLVKNKRSQDGKDDKDNDKGSKSRSQSMKEQAYNEDKDQEHSSLNDKSNLTDLIKAFTMTHFGGRLLPSIVIESIKEALPQCLRPHSGEIVSLKFIESNKEASGHSTMELRSLLRCPDVEISRVFVLLIHLMEYKDLVDFDVTTTSVSKPPGEWITRHNQACSYRPTWYKEKIYMEKKVPALEHDNKITGKKLDLLLSYEKHFEKVKKFNMDVKHGYVDLDLSNEDAEYMEFYEEYIKECLRHRDQMRHWESYVNGRPLEQRNERPE
ncbi:hypothetical protein Tco_0313970 [Tanacetum coccineum]